MHVTSPDVVSEITKRILSGCSIRDISREVGVSRGTVLRYRFLIAGEIELPHCDCGRPAGHRGWCLTRVVKSPARIEFLKRWGAEVHNTPVVNIAPASDVVVNVAQKVLLLNRRRVAGVKSGSRKKESELIISALSVNREDEIEDCILGKPRLVQGYQY